MNSRRCNLRKGGPQGRPTPKGLTLVRFHSGSSAISLVNPFGADGNFCGSWSVGSTYGYSRSCPPGKFRLSEVSS
jgi:hypothetical protein